MKNKILSVLFAAVMFVVCGVCVMAEEPRLCDYSGVLSTGEASDVSDRLDSVSSKYGMDIVVVTDSGVSASPRDYADDFSDYNGYGSDVILLFVDPVSRDWYISTKGYGITAVTDAGRDYMAEQFTPYLSEGDYYTAFVTFTAQCDDFVRQALSGSPYDVGNLPKGGFPFVLIPISLGIGMIIALIICLVWRAQLKSVCARESAVDYIRRDSFRVTRSRDIFLYSKLERREKPKDDGGSDTHISSSGAEHGGGGGKF